MMLTAASFGIMTTTGIFELFLISNPYDMMRAELGECTTEECYKPAYMIFFLVSVISVYLSVIMWQK